MSRMPSLTLPANLTNFLAKQREQADKLRAQHGIEAQTWYRITNATAPDEAELMLYDEIGGWYGATADQFIADLRGVTAPNLRVRINSPGGSVFEGIAIANALRSHPGNVVMQVDSVAASIASVIAMAGDRIEMAPNAMLMIHEASGVCLGNASDMEEMARLLALISDNIADAYVAKAGGTREQWREAMRAETWYLPEDAVTAGLADEALSIPKTGEPVEPEPVPSEAEPDMQRAWDMAAYGYAGPQRTQAPKPAPPVNGPEQTVTLTFPIGSAIDETVLESLRAAVKRRSEPVAPAVEDATPAVQADADNAATDDVTPDAPAEPVAVIEEPAPAALADDPAEPEPPAEEPDAWAAAVAHLTTPKPNPWADAFAHLVTPQPSSSAATAA